MQITPEQREQIVKPVRDGLVELVTGSPGLFRDRPGFIAGGGSNDRFSTAVRTLSQLNCRIWAARDKSGYSTTVNQGNAALCDPYLQSIGESPDDGSIQTPFTGGQCPANYAPSGTYTGTCPPVVGETINWQSGGVILGPIAGVRVVDGAYRVVGANGQSVPCNRAGTANILVDAGPGKPTQCGQLADPLAGAEGVTITNINPINHADDCGNPPPDLLPPGVSIPVTPPPPSVTINLPGVGPITVGVDLDPDGNPVFCVEEIDTCFSVDVGGDEGGAGGSGNVAPTTPGDAGDDQQTGQGGSADGSAPPGQELTGVLVEVIGSSSGANKFDNISAQVFRGIGYVAMGYPGLLGVDTSAAVVESPQFFHAQQRGLTAWRVRANVGFSLRTTPYYREVTE